MILVDIILLLTHRLLSFNFRYTKAYPDSNVAPTPSAHIPHPPSLQSMNAERTIDHLSLTVELLTKSYEQFKRHKSGRMTMFLASEIAGTYYTAGKFEMALK